MKTQTIYVDACTSTGIAIGRRNTYATEQIVFGLAPLVQQYGAGSAVLMVLRPTDTTPYPAVTSQSGTELTWTVSATDTSVPGTGECELYWYVDGGLAKSVIFPLTIQRDIITEPIDEPPEPYQTWVDDLTELGAETLQNAQAAAQSATDAEAAKTAAQTAQTGAEAAKTAAQGAQAGAETARTGAEAAQTAAETAQGKAEDAQDAAESAKTDAEEAARQAEEALEEFTTPTASANTLEPDEEATASYANGHFTFGIPQGVQGDPGQPGQPGVTPDFSIGTVQTLQPSQPATASITGTAEHPVLNLGIPQGVQGDPATNLVQSVNGKTGAVVLDAGDIGYDGETTYPDASVGAELTTINSALSSLSSVTEIIDTASGAIASFPDGAGLPMRSLVAEINPVQDLNGYSNPWPAGGGANQIPFSANKTVTANGLTFVFNDATITLTGTNTAGAGGRNLFRTEDFTLKAGTYYFYVFDASGSLAPNVFCQNDTSIVAEGSSSGASFTLSADSSKMNIGCNVAESGSTYNYSARVVISTTQQTKWSPYENICPISGHTGLSGARDGKNLYPHESLGAYSWGFSQQYALSDAVNPIFLKANTTYTLSIDSGNKLYRMRFWDISGTLLSEDEVPTIISGQSTGLTYYDNYKFYSYDNPNPATNICVITPKVDTWMDMVTQSTASTQNQLEVGSSASTYKEYTGTPISVSFGQTVYGGSDEVIGGNGAESFIMPDLSALPWRYRGEIGTGIFSAVVSGNYSRSPIQAPLSNTYKFIGFIVSVSYMTEDSSFGLYSETSDNVLYVKDERFTSVSAFAETFSSLQIGYELATPQSFTHEGQSVDTLVGQNNVWVDTGNVEVTYQASIKGYIDKVLGS